MSEFVNPDDTEDFQNIPYKYLVFRFIGRQRRLSSLRSLKCPEPIIKVEEELVQKAYNQMRDKCMQDKEYLAVWERE